MAGEHEKQVEPHHTSRGHDGSQARRSYLLFALNMVFGFVAMYLLMFTMVDACRISSTL